MLFDIFDYNINLAIAGWLIILLALIILFKNYITSLIDPLLFHLVWLASISSFFLIFYFQYGASIYFYIFTLTLVIYIASLNIFLNYYTNKKILFLKFTKININNCHFEKKELLPLIIVSVALYFYSNINFFIYLTTVNSLFDAFLFRYQDLQGRDIAQRIASFGTSFLIFFSLYGIFNNFYKKFAISLLVIFLFIEIISGGRSAAIVLLLYFGAFIFYFKHVFSKNFYKKLNRISVFLIVVAIFVLIFVTYHYNEGGGFNFAFFTVLNRFFANADGIEYYLKYSGYEYISSGLYWFFMSVFGVYVQTFSDIEYKNVGWQLTELVVGELHFAQGPNYIFLLQAIVFNAYVAPIYAIFVAWIIAKLRCVFTLKKIKVPLYFALSYISFHIAVDLEFAALMIASTFLIYLILYVPLMKIKFKA